MPNDNLLAQLSRDADRITDAIDRRQRALDGRLTQLERRLFDRIRDGLLDRFDIADGRLADTVVNLLLLARIDEVFEAWVLAEMPEVLRDFVGQILATSGLTAAMYADFDGPTVDSVLNDNRVLLAALGATETGAILPGSILADIAAAAQVRQDLKAAVLGSIKSGQTLREFTATIRDFVTGTPDADGRVKRYWRTYAYDLFNQAAEVKNEEFRRALNLRWFIYVGDIIKDSRAFCIKKAGKVFATVEADKDWPNDPDLIGKTSGIPYTPRIDRGRWNCRHRIRYISEELAVQLDPKKVNAIKEKHGSTRL